MSYGYVELLCTVLWWLPSFLIDTKKKRKLYKDHPVMIHLLLRFHQYFSFWCGHIIISDFQSTHTKNNNKTKTNLVVEDHLMWRSIYFNFLSNSSVKKNFKIVFLIVFYVKFVLHWVEAILNFRLQKFIKNYEKT